MMKNLEHWVPFLDFPRKILIDSISDDSRGLTIIIFNEYDNNDIYSIKFNNFYGYRNFNESERLRLFDKNPNIIIDWCFFKAKNTDFIKWLCRESLDIVKSDDINHFIITTADDIVEVLTTEYPFVERLSSGSCPPLRHGDVEE